MTSVLASSTCVLDERIGFTAQGRVFIHSDTRFSVEFPPGPIGIGNEEPINPEGKVDVDGVTITLLSPTQSIMDRLAAFFHWNDRQSLDQAVWIAQSQQHAVSIEKITTWATREGQLDKLRVFLNRVGNHPSE